MTMIVMVFLRLPGRTRNATAESAPATGNAANRYRTCALPPVV